METREVQPRWLRQINRLVRRNPWVAVGVGVLLGLFLVGWCRRR